MQIYWHDGEGHVVIENVVTVAVLLPDEKKFNTTTAICDCIKAISTADVETLKSCTIQPLSKVAP